MPLLQLHTSAAIADAERGALLQSASKLIAETLGKPEAYVMVALRQGPMCMAGELGPAAFADLRSIGGLSPAVNKRLAAKLCALIEQALHIAPERIFLNFTDVPPASWGHNGDTFG